jgi:hypothetical protein
MSDRSTTSEERSDEGDAPGEPEVIVIGVDEGEWVVEVIEE